MPVYTGLNDAPSSITTGFESIVIPDNFKSLRGGRSLDMTAFIAANPLVLFLAAGHIIIRETATGNYKPMPIAVANTQPYQIGTTQGVFDALPTGHTYAGALLMNLPVAKAMAGIVVEGTINDTVLPYSLTSAQKTAFVAAVPLVEFRSDNQ